MRISLISFLLMILLFGCNFPGYSTYPNNQPNNNHRTDRNNNSNSNHANKPADTSPSSDELIAKQASTDMHDKIIGAMKNNVIIIEQGKTLSIGLVYTRDEKTKGDESYASYLAQKMLMKMTQFNDAPYKIVATDKERKELLEKSGSHLDSAFDQTQISQGLGNQIPTNIGLFVEVKSINERTEELTIKLFTIHDGALFYAKSYPYASDYLRYVKRAEKAQADGDTKTADEYWHLASSSHGGNDTYSQEQIADKTTYKSQNNQQSYLQLQQIAQEVINIYQALNYYVTYQNWNINIYQNAQNRLNQLKSQTQSISKSSNYQGNAAVKEILYSIRMMNIGINQIIQAINSNRNPNFNGFYEDDDDYDYDDDEFYGDNSYGYE